MPDLWPYRPLPSITERLVWRTDIRTTPRREMRYSLRPARQEIDYTFNLSNENWGLAQEAYRKNPLGDWYVPLWWQGSPVSVASADTTIACDTNADYTGRAVIWSAKDNTTLVDIASVGPGLLTLTGAVGANHPDAWCMPVRLAYLPRIQEARLLETVSQISGTFHCRDAPDLSTTTAPCAIYIALDTSFTMTGTSIANEKTAAEQMLTDLKASAVPHDIRIVAFNKHSTTIERLDCDATKYDDLIAFVQGITASTIWQTDFAEGVSIAPAFFSAQTKPRICMIVSDGLDLIPPGTTTAAKAILDSISDVRIHGVSVGNVNTTHLRAMENTPDDGVPVIENAAGTGILSAVMQMAIADAVPVAGFPHYQGTFVATCAAAKLGRQTGSLHRPADYIDNGTGLVAIEQVREINEADMSAALARSGLGDSHRFRTWLHHLRGPDRDFWVPELGGLLSLVAQTTTTIDVRPYLPDVADYVGRHVMLNPTIFREITAATEVGSLHRLTVRSFATPTVRPRMLHRGRLRGDTVELRHMFTAAA